MRWASMVVILGLLGGSGERAGVGDGTEVAELVEFHRGSCKSCVLSYKSDHISSCLQRISNLQTTVKYAATNRDVSSLHRFDL